MADQGHVNPHGASQQPSQQHSAIPSGEQHQSSLGLQHGQQQHQQQQQQQQQASHPTPHPGLPPGLNQQPHGADVMGDPTGGHRPPTGTGTNSNPANPQQQQSSQQSHPPGQPGGGDDGSRSIMVPQSSTGLVGSLDHGQGVMLMPATAAGTPPGDKGLQPTTPGAIVASAGTPGSAGGNGGATPGTVGAPGRSTPGSAAQGDNPQCQVEGCGADLGGMKDYYRRHRVCETHAKVEHAVIGGRQQRFCQQCSRFHELEEFDAGRRSCRRRLLGHNKRRRKHPAKGDEGGRAAEGDGSMGYGQDFKPMRWGGNNGGTTNKPPPGMFRWENGMNGPGDGNNQGGPGNPATVTPAELALLLPQNSEMVPHGQVNGGGGPPPHMMPPNSPLASAAAAAVVAAAAAASGGFKHTGGPRVDAITAKYAPGSHQNNPNHGGNPNYLPQQGGGMQHPQGQGQGQGMNQMNSNKPGSYLTSLLSAYAPMDRRGGGPPEMQQQQYGDGGGMPGGGQPGMMGRPEDGGGPGGNPNFLYFMGNSNRGNPGGDPGPKQGGGPMDHAHMGNGTGGEDPSAAAAVAAAAAAVAGAFDIALVQRITTSVFGKPLEALPGNVKNEVVEWIMRMPLGLARLVPDSGSNQHHH